jgi:hypothetical protein
MNGAGAALVAELRVRGVELVAHAGAILAWPPRSLTDAEADEVRMHRAALLAMLEGELSWRVDAMRPQVPVTGPIPFLVAQPFSHAPGPGSCISCGSPVVPAHRARCRLCLLAVQLVLRGDADAG